MLLIPLVFFIIGLVLPVVGLVRAIQTSRQIGQLKITISHLGTRIDRLESSRQSASKGSEVMAPSPSSSTPPGTSAAEPEVAGPRNAVPSTPAEGVATESPTKTPPQPRRTSDPPPPPSPAVRTLPRFDWESFTGARLFDWLGGFALFLSFVFLVKFSVDMGLLSPAVRVALGSVVGMGLISGVRFAGDDHCSRFRTFGSPR